MELKIKNDVFYLLDLGQEKWLFDTEDGAIEALKLAVSKYKAITLRSVSLFEVDTSCKKWEIRSVTWEKIALMLPGEGG